MKREIRETTFQQLIDDGLLEIGDGYRAQNNELGGSGPIFLRAGHVTDSHIDFANVERFQAQLAEKVRPKMSCVGDTIITTKGNSTGRTSFVTDRLPPFVYSPHLSYWRTRVPKSLCSGFLRYWAQSMEFFNQLSGMKASTDMAPYLSLTDQRRLKITLPPTAEQKVIASVLGALDDKIELNRRMNATLEAIAQALFESWFVDAAASKPKSWEEISIAQICEINSWTLGKNDELASIDYVEISGVQSGNIANIQTYERGNEPSRARRRLRHGDTVVSTVRPDRGTYFLCLNPSPRLIASTGFAVLTPTKAPWSFIHAAMTQPEVFEYLGHHADGGAYPAVRPEIIGKLTVPWPKQPELLESFHDVCVPLYERAENNRLESRMLAELRNALLPKLLSGELPVPAKLVESQT